MGIERERMAKSDSEKAREGDRQTDRRDEERQSCEDMEKKEIETQKDSQRRETEPEREIQTERWSPGPQLPGSAGCGWGPRAWGSHRVGQCDGERIVVLH